MISSLSVSDIKKNAHGEEDPKPPPANHDSPALTHSSSKQTSPNVSPAGTTDEHQEDANSDQLNGKTNAVATNQSDDNGKNCSTASEPKDLESTQHEHDSNLSQGGPQTTEDTKQKIDEPVSAETKCDSAGGSEEKEEQQNQQNITSAEPDNMNPSASREPPDAAGDGPDGKDDGKTSSDPEGSVQGETVDDKMKSSGSCSVDEEQKKGKGKFKTEEST